MKFRCLHSAVARMSSLDELRKDGEPRRERRTADNRARSPTSSGSGPRPSAGGHHPSRAFCQSAAAGQSTCWRRLQADGRVETTATIDVRRRLSGAPWRRRRWTSERRRRRTRRRLQRRRRRRRLPCRWSAGCRPSVDCRSDLATATDDDDDDRGRPEVQSIR